MIKCFFPQQVRVLSDRIQLRNTCKSGGLQVHGLLFFLNSKYLLCFILPFAASSVLKLQSSGSTRFEFAHVSKSIKIDFSTSKKYKQIIKLNLSLKPVHLYGVSTIKKLVYQRFLCQRYFCRFFIAPISNTTVLTRDTINVLIKVKRATKISTTNRNEEMLYI